MPDTPGHSPDSPSDEKPQPPLSIQQIEAMYARPYVSQTDVRVPETNLATLKLARPIIWVAVGTAVFLASWLFPPKWFSYLLRDPHELFLDPMTFAYVVSCILAVVAGLFFSTT